MGLALLAGLMLLGWNPVAWAREEAPTVTVEGGSEEVRPEERTSLRGSGAYPGARTVIDLAPYSESGKTVADVLREVPGVQVTGGGEPLAPARVSIRGSRPDQVLVIVDGVPLTAQTARPARARREGGVGVDLAALPAANVASLEIVRGAATSLYGPHAAAGVVIVRTRSPSGSRNLEAAHTVGPGGFREDSATWREPLADGGLALHLSHGRSDGEFVFYDPAPAPDDSTRTDVEQCAPSLGDGYRLRRCNGKERTGAGGTWQRGKHQRWLADFSWTREEGLGGVLDPRPYGEATARRWLVGLEQRWLPAKAWTVGMDAGAAREAGERDENVTLNTGDQRNQHQEKRGHAELWAEHRQGLYRARAGGRAEVVSLNDRFFHRRREQTAMFGQWEAYLPAGGVEASLRGDRISDVGQAATYRLGATRYLGTRWGVKASHATGFRPPSLYELHDPASVFGPSPANPELEPERSATLDGGFFLEFAERFYGEVIGFQHRMTDQIVAAADPDSPALFRFQNLGRTRSTGVEAAVNLRLGAAWAINAAYQRNRAEILTGTGADLRETGNQVPGVPAYVTSTGVSWQSGGGRGGGWRFSLDQRGVGSRYIDTANVHYLRPYRLWEATAGFPLRWGFNGRLTGKNLLNETYAEMENHPPPGRQLFLTVSWRWPQGGAPGANPRSGADGSNGLEPGGTNE